MVKKNILFLSGIMISCCITLMIPCAFSQTMDISDKIWEGAGGKSNWEHARYFMFRGEGFQHESKHIGQGAFLWDRKTGNSRFEGEAKTGAALVVLFNIKEQTGKVFFDELVSADEELTFEIVNEVIDRFTKEAGYLFLPVMQDPNSGSIQVESEELIGSSRQVIVRIASEVESNGIQLNGKIYIDPQNGRIHQWMPEDKDKGYDVTQYKDIGGGIVLPTCFSRQGSNSKQKISYPLAAALVYIEERKFIAP